MCVGSFLGTRQSLLGFALLCHHCYHALICREGLSRRGSGRAGVGVWDFSDTKKKEGNRKFKHVVRSVFGRQLLVLQRGLGTVGKTMKAAAVLK